MSGPDLKALTQLTRRPDVWQGGLVRLPTWVGEPGETPFRVWAGAWVSLKTGLVHIGEVARGSDTTLQQALDAFAAFALDRTVAGYLPERVEVAGADVAGFLTQALSPLGVAVAQREDLRALQGMLQEFARAQGAGDPPPGVLDPPGVTVERVASFAEAARLFYEAAPWRHLTDEDLIRVEEPRGPAEMSHAVVLGNGGQEFGLLLFERPAFHEALLEEEGDAEVFGREARHCVFFGDPDEMPLQDADLFEDQRLPVAGPAAYPWAAQVGPKRRLRRLGPRALAHVEAVLRALAATTEPEIDRGRWTRLVPSPDGAVRVTLALPDLLDKQADKKRRQPLRMDRRAMERTLAEVGRFLRDHPAGSIDEMNRTLQERFIGRPMDEIPSTASTPLEKAQDLCYAAFEARGRRRLLLARRALEICPDCADAYALLAEHSADPDEELRLWREGVSAGERALGPERFEEEDAPFWGDVRTRPFMRALEGLAAACKRRGLPEEAIRHYQRLLRLNPNDNQGVRDPLAGLLLRVGDDAALESLVKQYPGPMEPTLLFADALRRFRRGGDAQDCRRALSPAVDSNPFVPDLLLGRVPQPPTLPSSYSPGSPDEAAHCADYLAEAWKSTPGALEWLEKRQPGQRRKGGTGRGPRRARRTRDGGRPSRPRRPSPPARP